MGPYALEGRGIVSVAGEDAEALLNRLFTNNVLHMDNGAARYAALLSPQGKILYDFFVFKRPDAFWIDCQRAHSAELTRKMTMFRLRAKATIEDRSDELGIAVAWGGALMDAPGPAFRDPRHNRLGYRIVVPRGELAAFEAVGSHAYEALRIELGVPEGGIDFPYGDTFVHDANLDLLHGVDFTKGCYVGQEVVSRVHHRNSARKRIVKVQFHGDAPAIGAELTAAAAHIGTMTSVCDQDGLATVRIDRLADAESTNIPIAAAGTTVTLTLPTESFVEPPAYAEDAI